jgi:sugar phosphate isomerase/epimerase
MKLSKRDLLKLGVAAIAVPRLFGQRVPRVFPKLGILTRYSEKNFEIAAQIGCESLQLHAAPGNSIDAAKLSAAEGSKIVQKAAAMGMAVSSYGCTFNHLGPAPEAAQRNQAYFRQLIAFAADTGVKVIGTHTGLIKDGKMEANLEAMKRAFSPYLELAEKHKVQIALENYPGQNFATTPENFERIFNFLPSRWLGLEYDPSHFVRQFIDPVAPARQFQDRIYHVHAKDTEIIEPVLQKRGITGEGWWRYRLPGFGRVKWAGLITVLLDANYAGAIDVEHEDALFDWGNRAPDITEGQKQGYRIALRYLGQFIPGKA